MNEYHFAGRPGCACEICRPHLAAKEVISHPDVQPNSVEHNAQPRPSEGGAPFPPRQAKPPNHYLKKAESWDVAPSESDGFRRPISWKIPGV